MSIKNEMITGTYLDNRLGLYNALCVAEDLQDGVIVFSTYEEHGGGSVPFLTRYVNERFNIGQALISDYHLGNRRSYTWRRSGYFTSG